MTSNFQEDKEFDYGNQSDYEGLLCQKCNSEIGYVSGLEDFYTALCDKCMSEIFPE